MGMITGSSLEMGVAYPILNYRFIYGESYQGILNSTDETVNNLKGQTQVEISPSSIPTDVRNLIVTSDEVGYNARLADKILIGPSSAVDSQNNATKALESWRIKNATNTLVNFVPRAKYNSLINDYKTGDKFSFLSGKMPKGWSIPNNNPFGKTTATDSVAIYSLYQNYKAVAYPAGDLTTIGHTGSGSLFDDNAFTFVLSSDRIAFHGDNSPGVRYTGATNLLPFTKYRFGVGAMLSKAGANAKIDIKAYDPGNDMVIQFPSIWTISTDVLTGTSVWQNLSNESTNAVGTKGTTGKPVFDIWAWSSTGASSRAYIKLAYMYLEHAKGTTLNNNGRTGVNNDVGYYTFPDLPELGTNQWKFREVSDSKFPYKKYTWSAAFRNVASSFYINLMILDHYQKLGNRMIFHTQEESGSNLPPVLQGHFKISNLIQTHWSKALIDFNFTFIED